MEETVKQSTNTHDLLEKEKSKTSHLAPWQFKPGQSGNPNGRPKTKTLKEYVRDMLASMTDDERQEYLKGMDKEAIWKMAEGNWSNNTDLTSKGEKILVLPSELIPNETDKGSKPDSTGQAQV